MPRCEVPPVGCILVFDPLVLHLMRPLRGLRAVLTSLRGTPVSRSSEDPRREAQENSDISYLQSAADIFL